MLRYFAFFLAIMKGIANQEDTNDQKCKDYFLNITESLVEGSMPSLLSPQTVQYSGKGLQDLGLYLVCREQEDLHYIHLRLKSGKLVFHIGFCLPKYCEMDYLQTKNETTKEVINNLTEIQFNKSLVESASYLDPELLYPDWKIGTCLTLIILLGIIILNVLGSIFALIAENKKKKYEKNLKSTMKKKNSGQYDDSKTEDIVLKENIDRQGLIQNDSVEDNGQSLSINGRSQFQEINYIRYIEPSWQKYAFSFSFIHNYQKLFKIETPKGENASFVVFNGIRALSIFWVIFGHEQLIRGNHAFNIVDYSYKITEVGWLTIAPAGYFAVDVFFFVSGFLAAVLLLEKLIKLKTIQISLVPAMWLHRLLRIWPTYAICVLVYWQLSIYWSNGPIWNEYITLADTCSSQWWKNLLFIDNMFSHTSGAFSYCFAWGWYLANDFQIFLITPFLLILYAKHRKTGLAVIILMLIASMLTAYLIAFKHDYHVQLNSPTAKPQPDYSDVFYYKPWVRISPYLIGILFGLLYRNFINGKNKKLIAIASKIKNSILIRTLFYIIGLGLTQTVIWIIAPLQKDIYIWPPQAQYLYLTFNRVFFVLGVGFCITPALLGCLNDPSRIILGHPFWVPIARISFCMYLVHCIVIFFNTFSVTQLTYYQYSHILYFTLTDIFYSAVVGGLISLAIEVPCMNLEKIVFAPKNLSKKKQTK